jgi:hypothetical protein
LVTEIAVREVQADLRVLSGADRTLPDGDKEMQLTQGLLNQRGQVEERARDKRLF